ncbi:unnamed protein product [Pleuronectes platessa]|uniref:Uncharacterized protein n=1 Tax=Pleuronectes platessa TaxID=8262 RepID=A0A9N7Z6M8_PLEPL|nr:unnamed protein product [Pleuronectes platessa]
MVVVMVGGVGWGEAQTDRKTFPSRYAHLHNSLRSRRALILTWDNNDPTPTTVSLGGQFMSATTEGLIFIPPGWERDGVRVAGAAGVLVGLTVGVLGEAAHKEEIDETDKRGGEAVRQLPAWLGNTPAGPPARSPAWGDVCAPVGKADWVTWWHGYLYESVDLAEDNRRGEEGKQETHAATADNLRDGAPGSQGGSAEDIAARKATPHTQIQTNTHKSLVADNSPLSSSIAACSCWTSDTSHTAQWALAPLVSHCRHRGTARQLLQLCRTNTGIGLS